MAPLNRFELCRKALTQLETAVNSLRREPTQQTVDVLLDLTATVAKLLYVATVEVATQQHTDFSQDCADLKLKIEDL